MDNIWKNIKAWFLNNDYVILIPPGVVLIVLCAVAKLWYWTAFFSSIAGIVLAFEFTAWHFTGLSISDQFRTWKVKHPVLAKSILIAFGTFAATLIFHLSLKVGG